MLAALSDRLERLYLLTDDVPESFAKRAEAYPQLQMVPLGRKAFKKNAFIWLEDRVAGGELDIVHDTFGHLASFFQAYGPRSDRPFRLVNTLYTTNWGWFNRVRRGDMDFGLRYMAQRVICLWRDRRVCLNADRVIVLGPGHVEDLVNGHRMDRSRVDCLPSEVDIGRFCPGDDASRERTMILFVGVVCRNKGLDVLMKALADLAQTRSGLDVRFVGPIVPWEEQWFNEERTRLGLDEIVTTTGRVEQSDLIELYRQAQLFVFPSRFEGSPRSVREALACGCRVLASDIPGHRGLDPDESFMGFVPDFDPQSWVRAMHGFLEEPHTEAAQRAERGVEHMKRVHSFEAVGESLLELYERIQATPPWSGGAVPKADAGSE